MLVNKSLQVQCTKEPFHLFITSYSLFSSLSFTLQSRSVEIAGSTGGTVEYVDETTNFNPPNKTTIVANTFNLNAFGVAVVTL